MRAQLSRRVGEDEELGERGDEKAFFSSGQCGWHREARENVVGDVIQEMVGEDW